MIRSSIIGSAWLQDWARYQLNHDEGSGPGSVMKSLQSAAAPDSEHGSAIAFNGDFCNQPIAMFFAKNNCTTSSFTLTASVR